MRPTTQPTDQHPSRSLNRGLHGALALVIVSLALTGCARTTLLAPETASEQAPAAAAVQAPPPPSRLSMPADSGQALLGLGGPITALLDWQLIANVLVRTGVDQSVQGGRYHLRFSKSSLERNETISIKTYDVNTLDVQFGPHGTRFKTPVELSIDFTGTAADPGSRIADASEPVLWYLDEAQNQWVEVPGMVDWAHKRYVVHLEHFSRYVLGGKAGWKHAPQTETAE